MSRISLAPTPENCQ